MKTETFTLHCDRGEIKVSVLSSPPGLSPIDEYREVRVEIPAKGLYSAVLFHLPDQNSDDPYAVMPIDEWTVPAKWDDNQMLYVPSFGEKHIRDALAYVLDRNLEDNAFEQEDSADSNSSDVN